MNSLRVRISQIVPADGKRFTFQYEYDFGDGWEHEILFEGCLRLKTGCGIPDVSKVKGPAPREDVGGIDGYDDYLAALADPEHEEHASCLQWRGPFDPEAFSAERATKAMRRGLPNGAGDGSEERGKHGRLRQLLCLGYLPEDNEARTTWI